MPGCVPLHSQGQQMLGQHGIVGQQQFGMQGMTEQLPQVAPPPHIHLLAGFTKIGTGIILRMPCFLISVEPVVSQTCVQMRMRLRKQICRYLALRRQLFRKPACSCRCRCQCDDNLILAPSVLSKPGSCQTRRQPRTHTCGNRCP